MPSAHKIRRSTAIVQSILTAFCFTRYLRSGESRFPGTPTLGPAGGSSNTVKTLKTALFPERGLRREAVFGLRRIAYRAFASQEPAQSNTRLMQLRLGVSDGASQFARDFAMSLPLHVMQKEDGSVSGRKSTQSAMQRNPVYGPDQREVLYRAGIQHRAFS